MHVSQCKIKDSWNLDHDSTVANMNSVKPLVSSGFIYSDLSIMIFESMATILYLHNQFKTA